MNYLLTATKIFDTIVDVGNDFNNFKGALVMIKKFLRETFRYGMDPKEYYIFDFQMSMEMCAVKTFFIVLVDLSGSSRDNAPCDSKMMEHVKSPSIGGVEWGFIVQRKKGL